MKPTGRKALTTVIIVLGVTLLCLLPVLVPRTFEVPTDSTGGLVRSLLRWVSVLLPLATAVVAYRIRIDLDRRGRVLLVMLLAVLALLLTEVHYVQVDRGNYFGGPGDNTVWQMELHRDVLALSPDVKPHSYRFLPNCVVRIIEVVVGDFVFARTIYRITATLALLYAIYYFARSFVGHRGGVITVLLYCMIFPISIRLYAGQLTDPLSHLSFVLAFIFLRQRRFPEFALTVLIGALAKETILAMAFYPLLFGGKEKRQLIREGVLATLALVVFVGVRTLVAPSLDYEVFSGVDSSHLRRNFVDMTGFWIRQIVFSIGLFFPFALITWKSTDRMLRNLVLFLLPVLLASGLMFSWLHESRNYVPLIVPLAIMTVHCLFPVDGSRRDGPPSTH